MSSESKLSLNGSPQLFERAHAFADAVGARLRAILGEDVEIRPVGATSVPGCLTKGDVDIVVRTEAARFASLRDILDAQFDKNLGSPRDENFASYADDSQEFPLGIQLVVTGTQHDNFHSFTHRLRQSDELLASYNDLKRSFSGSEMEAYRKAKAEFIGQHLGETEK